MLEDDPEVCGRELGSPQGLCHHAEDVWRKGLARWVGFWSIGGLLVESVAGFFAWFWVEEEVVCLFWLAAFQRKGFLLAPGGLQKNPGSNATQLERALLKTWSCDPNGEEPFLQGN